MRKIFTLIAVLAAAFSANAEIIIDKVQKFEGLDKFPFYVMGYEPQIVNGVLTSHSTDWHQYFVMDGCTYETGKEYTVTALMRGSKAGSLNVQLGDWGKLAEKGLDFGTEWAEYSCTRLVATASGGFVVFQPGTYDGTIEIKQITLSHEGVAKVIPTDGNVLATWYDGKGGQFFGWGAGTRENVEFEGKPCMKFTNEAAVNEWESQLATDITFEFGTEYYLSFDIKGDAFEGLPISFQHMDGYKDKGGMTKFNVTPEWSHVIAYGEPSPKGDETLKADRMLFNLGKYVGTFHLTNAKLYTASSSLFDIMAPAKPSTGVYNLMGVKVAAELTSDLPAGIYIVDGKKVAKR